MVKYSFILPVYKVENYLEIAIKSILKQSVSNFEIILINDGSPDKCPEICDKYEKLDSRIRVIHQKNSGVSTARNKGIDVANGEYILFLDSDDYIEENYLTIIEQYIGNNDILIFGYKNIYKNKTTNGFSENNLLSQDKAFEYLIEDDKFCGFLWNKVFKSSIIKNNSIRFDSSISMGEDLLFCYQYFEKINNALLIDNYLINYRQRKSSAMATKVKNVSASTLIKTFSYILDNSNNEFVLNKCKSLYLKSYYKYKKYVKKNDFNFDLISTIKKNDYKFFSNKDKKIIIMYKFFPFIRTLLYGLKDIINIKFD